MTDAFQNQQHELHLIAYLDGELDREERLLADTILKENPELVVLLEQWRENGKNLRALPRYRLDASFTNRVLENLETIPSVRLNDRSATPPPLTPTTKRSRAVTWWVGIASVTTLAALLLAMVSFFPDATTENPVIGQADQDGPEMVAQPNVGDFNPVAGANSDSDASSPSLSDSSPALAQNARSQPHRIVRPPMAMQLKQGDLTETVDAVAHVVVITIPPATETRDDWIQHACLENSIRIIRSGNLVETPEGSDKLADLKQAIPQIRGDGEAVFVVATVANMRKLAKALSETSQVHVIPVVGGASDVDPSEVDPSKPWFGDSEQDDDSRLIHSLLFVGKQ